MRSKEDSIKKIWARIQGLIFDGLPDLIIVLFYPARRYALDDHIDGLTHQAILSGCASMTSPKISVIAEESFKLGDASQGQKTPNSYLAGVGPHPRKNMPTKEKHDLDELIEVRILAKDGYRTQIPSGTTPLDAPLKYVDHFFPRQNEKREKTIGQSVKETEKRRKVQNRE